MIPVMTRSDARAQCQLWLIDLQAPVDEADWLACSPAEHARAARFKFERDARRYRAAHAAMRGALSQALGMAPDRITYAQGPQGKPCLAAPDSHSGPPLHFNLSHSGDWALLGTSPTHHIGVDIECHRPMPDMASVARQVFSEAEQQALHACPPDAQATLFFRTWVGKEACLKALGSGLSVDARCVSAVWSSTWAPATITLPHVRHEMVLQGLSLPIQAEAVEAAVALWLPDEPAMAAA